jgi:hypothetical protein
MRRRVRKFRFAVKVHRQALSDPKLGPRCRFIEVGLDATADTNVIVFVDYESRPARATFSRHRPKAA